MNLQSIRTKAKHSWQLIKHFQHPLVVPLARLGWIKVDYCSFRVRKGKFDYNVLGRPLGGDHRILREVLVDETYRPLLELLPPEPVRLLEIGAHIGAFTIWLHLQHGISEAFCFEPDLDSFALCQLNFGRHGPSNFQLHGKAIGGATRESEIWIDQAAHAKSSLLSKRANCAGRQSKVQVIALSEWLKQIEGDFDVLKMDCEGSEWEILDANPAVFARFSVIIAEIHNDPSRGRNIYDFASALGQNGFTTVSSDHLYIGRRNLETTNSKIVSNQLEVSKPAPQLIVNDH
jgi:FkbM family methyltransferase